MPLPGHLPSHKDKVMILPSDITKVFVYSMYKQACESSSRSAVGRSKFYDIWQHQLPHISICPPSADLLHISAKYKSPFAFLKHKKATRLATAQEHLLRAKTERNRYNSQVDTAQKAWTLSRTNRQPPRTHTILHSRFIIHMIPNRHDRSTSRQLGSVESVMMEITNKSSI